MLKLQIGRRLQAKEPSSFNKFVRPLCDVSFAKKFKLPTNACASGAPIRIGSPSRQLVVRKDVAHHLTIYRGHKSYRRDRCCLDRTAGLRGPVVQQRTEKYDDTSKTYRQYVANVVAGNPRGLR